MGRRGRKSKGSDKLVGWMAIIGAALYIIYALLMILLPLAIVGGSIYFYLQWQKEKLAEHNGDWNAFYHQELKSKLKIAAVILPIAIGIGYWQYSEYQQEQAVQRAIFAAEREEQLAIERAKKDSANMYYDQGAALFANRKYQSAILQLDSALGMYTTALRPTKKREGEIYLLQGKSLLKLRKKKEAIAEIYAATVVNNKEAIELYDQVNPLIKEFSHHVVRCCDGTTSSSSGSGACSHHGGVCNWKSPVYRERRKYQFADNN